MEPVSSVGGADTDPPRRVVAVANGRYATNVALPTAVLDSIALLRVLQTEHHFEPRLLRDLTRDTLVNQLEVALAKNSCRNGTLIVCWIGHGEQVDDGALSLLARTRDQDGSDEEAISPQRLGVLAARTGATQILVVLDTCYSGAGVVAAATSSRAVYAGRRDAADCWFGVVAACRSDEQSLAGVLSGALYQILAHGPRHPDARERFGPTQPRVTLEDLSLALSQDWDQPEHTIDRLVTGRPDRVLANPFRRPGIPPQTVESVRHSASGTSLDEDFFTGRTSILTELCTWLKAQQPGITVLTGPAGSGKSAILGRLLCLSVGSERTRIVAARQVPPGADPGRDSIDVYLQARRADARAVTASLVEQLNLDTGDSLYGVLDLAAHRHTQDNPLVVLVDGLDEAGDHLQEIATKVLAPLGEFALVLIGTRPHPDLTALGAALIGTVDLAMGAGSALDDVRNYVIARLSGVSTRMDPAQVADVVVGLARPGDIDGGFDPDAGGPFLLARLVTSQLRESPVDTGVGGWERQLAVSVEEALDRDLTATVLVVGRHAHPTAARELLGALTLAYGSGLPLEVWPVVAGAMSPTATIYSIDDVRAALGVLGRHVVVDRDGGEAVYRLAHQRMVEHLRASAAYRADPAARERVAGAVAAVIGRLIGARLDAGMPLSTYLGSNGWRHLADAGEPGLQQLTDLAERSTDLVLGLAAATSHVARSLVMGGTPDRAVELAELAVERFRALGDPVDISDSLSDLAIAANAAGRVDLAGAAADEAADVLVDAGDDLRARPVLVAALAAQALTRLEADPASALASAQRAVELSERDGGAARARSAAARITVARASLLSGDLDTASASVQRAREDLAAVPTSEGVELGRAEALAVAANVDMARTLAGAAPTPDVEATIGEVLTLASGTPTGALADLHLANAMQAAAQTVAALQARGVDAAAGWSAVDLIDGAIDRARSAPPHRDTHLLVAMCLMIRAAYASLDDAMTMLDEVGELVGRYLEVSPVARAIAGHAMATAVELRRLRPDADLIALRDDMAGAVELLTSAPAGLVRGQLAGSLINLADLQALTGSAAAAADTLDLAIAALRDQPTGPDVAVTLGSLLSDRASRLCNVQPFQAIADADEALVIAERIGHPVLRGFALLNRGVAQLRLDRKAAAVADLTSSAALLEPQATSSTNRAGLATALQNLGYLALRNDDPSTALNHCGRAARLFDTAGTPRDPQFRAVLEICLGRAEQLTGADADGGNRVRSGIDALIADLGDSPTEAARCAAALAVAGPDVYDEVLGRLAQRPVLAALLRLCRDRAPDEQRALVDDFVTALMATDLDTRMVRQIARAQRHRHPEPFDEAWRDATGGLPSWLPIDSTLADQLNAWLVAEPWPAARSFLDAHPDLLGPDVDVLLGELEDAWPDDVLAARSTLALARQAGVAAAYAPIRLRNAVDEWAVEADSTPAELHFDMHAADLLSADAAALIDQRRQAVPAWVSPAEPEADRAHLAHALLTLIRRGERVLAFSLLSGTGDPALLLTAAQADDVERLEAMALLFGYRSRSEDDRRTAAALLAIVDVRTDRSDGLAFARMAAGDADVATRARLAGLVPDSMIMDPGHAAALAVVLGTLKIG